MSQKRPSPEGDLPAAKRPRIGSDEARNFPHFPSRSFDTDNDLDQELDELDEAGLDGDQEEEDGPVLPDDAFTSQESPTAQHEDPQSSNFSDLPPSSPPPRSSSAPEGSQPGSEGSRPASEGSRPELEVSKPESEADSIPELSFGIELEQLFVHHRTMVDICAPLDWPECLFDKKPWLAILYRVLKHNFTDIPLLDFDTYVLPLYEDDDDDELESEDEFEPVEISVEENDSEDSDSSGSEEDSDTSSESSVSGSQSTDDEIRNDHTVFKLEEDVTIDVFDPYTQDLQNAINERNERGKAAGERLTRRGNYLLRSNKPENWYEARLEIVSPKYTDANIMLTHIQQIFRHMETPKSFIANVPSAGFHVHVGRNDDQPMDLRALKRLMFATLVFESEIDRLHASYRQFKHYFKTNKLMFIADQPTGYRFKDADKNWRHLKPLVQVRREIFAQPDRSNLQYNDRHLKVNFSHIRTPRTGDEKNYATVEFRQHASTSDPEEIYHWTIFCVELVRWAHRDVPDDRFLPWAKTWNSNKIQFKGLLEEMQCPAETAAYMMGRYRGTRSTGNSRRKHMGGVTKYTTLKYW